MGAVCLLKDRTVVEARANCTSLGEWVPHTIARHWNPLNSAYLRSEITCSTFFRPLIDRVELAALLEAIKHRLVFLLSLVQAKRYDRHIAVAYQDLT